MCSQARATSPLVIVHILVNVLHIGTLAPNLSRGWIVRSGKSDVTLKLLFAKAFAPIGREIWCLAVIDSSWLDILAT
jgi:hypothetical protein